MNLLRRIFNRRSKAVKLQPLAARRRGRWWRWGRWALLGLLVVIVLTLLVAAYYYPKAKQAMAAANTARAHASELQTQLSQQDFPAAQATMVRLQRDVDQIRDAVRKMQGLRSWPYIGRQYRAVEQLLAVGDDSLVGVDALVDFGAHLFAPFFERGKITLASISPEDKGKILAGISEREDDLKTAQAAIARAGAKLEDVPDSGLVPRLQNVVTPLKQQFPLIKRGLDQAIPATHVLPTLLGYPTPKSYLFLFENNTELRPGGGFIGTYGVMKLHSGEIVSLVTDNSYNLDEAAKSLPRLAPPEPMVRYLKANNWYFRDSNWSPDFPTSANQALTLYKREGGQRNLDGVIAVTPSAISALLELVGSIKVDGIEFTPENFTDRLQEHVDRGFLRSGLDESERKDIIGDMTTELVDRLLRLPVSEWGELFIALGNQLSKKQVLFYMEDSGLQSILVELNWAGALNTAENEDYLMVVDANLASLKTDPVMRRTYTRAIRFENNQAVAELTIRYENTGKFDWKTTRYNTYTRVYVPAGAELIESSGAQLREKSNRPGEVTTTTELGKTVFGAFKSIEPGTSSELRLVYRLPGNVLTQVEQNRYVLHWQKQPGMVKPMINLTVQTPNRIPSSAAGLDNQAKLGKDSVSFSGPLDEDRRIEITLQP